MELVEQLRHGWGYDQAGHWHGGIANVKPIREETELDEDDPLAPARGIMWGLLFTVMFFWLPIGAAVVLWWAR